MTAAMGEPRPSGTCARCGATLRETSRFCPSCGARVEQQGPPRCPACGTVHTASAKFCRSCGASLPGAVAVAPRPAAAKRSISRRPVRAPWLAVGAVAAVAVLAVVGIWAMTRGDGGGETETPASGTQSTVTVLDENVPPVDELGRPVRPPVRLDHPDGATAEVPGGPVVYGTEVDFERFSLPDDSSLWDRGGIAWRFVSNAGLVADGDIVVELPATGSPGETVIALASTGAWVPLQPVATSGSDGKPALRVSVREIPAPWIVAVAKPVKGVSLPPEATGAVHAETLYWTDRASWESEVRAWLPQAELVSTGVAAENEDRAILAAAAAERSWWDVWLDLERAQYMLGATRLWSSATAAATGLTFSDMLPGIESGVSGFQLYVSGIDRLAIVRDDWAMNRDRYIADAGGDLSELIVPDGQTIEQSLESTLYAYAPWGVRFTRWMLRTGTLEGLDLRVLRPYGQLYYADVIIKDTKENANGVLQADLDSAMAPFVKESATVQRFLRLYSTWAIENTSWLDVFRDWKGKADFVLRYWGVISSTAGWLVGAITPAGLVATVGLALADEAIDYLGAEYQAAEDGQAWASFEVLGDEVAFSSALPIALAWAESKSQTLHAFVANTDELTFSPAPKDVISNLIDVGLTVASLNSDWYMLKDIRAITKDVEGYCPRSDCGYLTARNVPPIQIVATIRGELAGQPEGAYPVRAHRLLAWNVNYASFYQTIDVPEPSWFYPDYHEILLAGGADPMHLASSYRVPYPFPSRGRIDGGVADLDVALYKPELGEKRLSIALRTEPHMQILRIGIPRTILTQVAADYGLGDNPPFADYQFVLRLETPEGLRNQFILTNEAARKASDDPDVVYVAVQLARKDFEVPADMEEAILLWNRGERQAMDGGVLRTNLAVKLKAHSDTEPRMSFAADFTEGDVRLAPLDALTGDSPRVHFLAVTGEASDFTPARGSWVLTGTQVIKEEEQTRPGETFTLGGSAGSLSSECSFAGDSFNLPGSASSSLTWGGVPATAGEDVDVTIDMEANATHTGYGCYPYAYGSAEVSYLSSAGVEPIDPFGYGGGPSVEPEWSSETEHEAVTIQFPDFEDVWGIEKPDLEFIQLAAARAKERPKIVFDVGLHSFGTITVRYTYQWTVEK